MNVAVIGAGKWSENHLAAWRAHGVNVAWVVRSSEERAKQTAAAWNVPKWSANYREVVQRDDVDIVDILLPHDLHAEAACVALASGKDVFLEKPVAPTLAQARQIIEAGRRHRRKVMVAENWVYSTWVEKAHGIVAKGEIGKPFCIRAITDIDIRPYCVGLDWKYSRARMGGGGLMDGAIHNASVFRYLLGEVREVTAMTANHAFREIAPMEDTSVVSMRFESGSTGAILHNWVAQRERAHSEFVILGDEGTIEFDMYSPRFFVTRGKRRCEESLQSGTSNSPLPPSRGFLEETRHFLDCLRDNRDPLTSAEEQMGSLKVILAAYKSVEVGRTIGVADLEG